MDKLSAKEKQALDLLSYDLLIETFTSILEKRRQVVLFPLVPLTDPLIDYIESRNIKVRLMPKTMITKGLRSEIWIPALVLN